MPKVKLYPLKFKPQLKEKVWGGTLLQKLYGKDGKGAIGESWELSAVPLSVSKVAHGPLEESTLQDLIDSYKEELLGENVWKQYGNQFPLLFKYIHAKQDLSVQVHPNDKVARQKHNSFGKTEMWYVMEATKDARLILGFKDLVSKENYLEKLNSGNVLEILHEEPVKKGDVFHIDPGTVHAIGGGIVLAEIQQTSDITYRIYDWDRPDSSGNLRELHTQEALDVINFSHATAKQNYLSTKNKPVVVCASPYYITSVLELDDNYSLQLKKNQTFTVLMCTEGKASIQVDDFEIDFNKGETILIPASFEYVSLKTKNATILQVQVP